MIETVRDRVKHLLDTAELQHWGTDQTIVRYLRARKFRLDKAIEMIINTIMWSVCLWSASSSSSCTDHPLTVPQYVSLTQCTKLILYRRRVTRPEDITFSQVENESKWGKIYILTKNDDHSPVLDKSGRPVVVIRPRNEHNMSTKEDALRHFAYIMDIASDLADKHSPDLKLAWVRHGARRNAHSADLIF